MGSTDRVVRRRTLSWGAEHEGGPGGVASAQAWVRAEQVNDDEALLWTVTEARKGRGWEGEKGNRSTTAKQNREASKQRMVSQETECNGRRGETPASLLKSH